MSRPASTRRAAWRQPGRRAELSPRCPRAEGRAGAVRSAGQGHGGEAHPGRHEARLSPGVGATAVGGRRARRGPRRHGGARRRALRRAADVRAGPPVGAAAFRHGRAHRQDPCGHYAAPRHARERHRVAAGPPADAAASSAATGAARHRQAAAAPGPRQADAHALHRPQAQQRRHVQHRHARACREPRRGRAPGSAGASCLTWPTSTSSRARPGSARGTAGRCR